MDTLNPKIDPNSGFCSLTTTFHSLRPPIPLPPETTPISAAAFSLSLRPITSSSDSISLIDAASGRKVSYSDLARSAEALAASLQSLSGISKGDVAFVLSTNSIRVPVLYLALLSIGVVISPANPVSTASEICRLVDLCKPVIAFATSDTARKVPNLRHRTVIIDSPEFDSMMTCSDRKIDRVEVKQSDLAAILYSSGTTGEVKGVMLTHRNLIAVVAGFHAQRQGRATPEVVLYPVPYFHVFGFFYSLKSVALNECVVVMERFDLVKTLRAVEEFRVRHVALVPPVVVAMVKGDVTDGFDLRSLEDVGCGGAPLGKEVITAFMAKFPGVALLWQGYGMTESTGVAFRAVNPEEGIHWGSVGKLVGSCEAKIVDCETGISLPPLKQGELWIKGPNVMKGYVGNPKATSETLVSGEWLRTGDLCYIDNEGFLFIVDRLKELIKYKGYQVAPAELEHLLQSHPEIVDAAVIPYPDTETGEVPLAFVVRRPQSSLNEKQVMDFIAKQVAPYKKIRRVRFTSSIPKSASGKILRKDLRKTVFQGIPSKL